MQLCVDATLPREFGGMKGESIYIDSEGSFSPERCHDMATALINHVHLSSKRSNGRKIVPEYYTTDSILDSIHVFRVHNETCQTATIYSIPNFLTTMKEQGRNVQLVVIDSIAFHYRVSK